MSLHKYTIFNPGSGNSIEMQLNQSVETLKVSLCDSGSIVSGDCFPFAITAAGISGQISINLAIGSQMIPYDRQCHRFGGFLILTGKVYDRYQFVRNPGFFENLKVNWPQIAQAIPSLSPETFNTGEAQISKVARFVYLYEFGDLPEVNTLEKFTAFIGDEESAREELEARRRARSLDGASPQGHDFEWGQDNVTLQ